MFAVLGFSRSPSPSPFGFAASVGLMRNCGAVCCGVHVVGVYIGAGGGSADDLRPKYPTITNTDELNTSSNTVARKIRRMATHCD